MSTSSAMSTALPTCRCSARRSARISRARPRAGPTAPPWSCASRTSAGPMPSSTRVDAFAAGLLALGLEPGDRVGIWSPNNAEWVVTQFATAKAGLILVNINPAYRTARAGIRAEQGRLPGAGHRRPAFKTSDYLGHAARAGAGAGAAQPGAAPGCAPAALETVIQIGGTSPGHHPVRRDRAPSAPPSSAPAWPSSRGTLQFDEPINIQFTSGTTGAPKGATLTHHNILNNGFFIGEAQRLGPEDKVCIPVPLYHCFGMVLGNLACITHGSAMVYPGERLRSAGGAADRARGALHRALRRAHHVHRRARPSRVRALRPLLACAPASWRARPARSR